MEEVTALREEIARQRCVLCGVSLNPRDGNNPYPLAEDGACCGKCNETKVIPARIRAIIDGATNGAAASH
jgi:hypothetical protein